MLQTDARYGPWAASGEIDIMEAVNLGTPSATGADGREDQILGTLHFGGAWPKNTHKSNRTALPPSADGFHVFGIDWSAGRISWSVDGKVHATQTAADWSSTADAAQPATDAPFDQRFHLIVNLAIGGGLPEGRNQRGVVQTGFPKALVVDWVRVYRCTADPETGTACVP
jgi:beta-glucanase (GH16 family)